MAIIAAVVAMGGGLHVAAYYIEHHSELDAAATILTVAIPVAVALAGVYGALHVSDEHDRQRSTGC